MTIGDLLITTFVGKEVKLTKTVYERKGPTTTIDLGSGKVTHIYEDGDRYCGYCYYFRFENGIEVDVDDNTEITIL